MGGQHVGEVLAEILEERGETQVAWARRLGCSTKHLNQILTCKVGLTADLAVHMEAFLDLDAESLMLTQVIYEVDAARHRLTAEMRATGETRRSRRAPARAE